MIFQSISIFNFIIFLLSVIFVAISLILKIFRLNGFFIIAGSIIVYFISIFFKNLFLQFISSSVLFIYYFLIIYYLIIFLYYKNKKFELTSIHDGIIHPFEKKYLKIDAKRIPINFPCIFFLLKFDIFEDNKFIRSETSYIESNTKKSIAISAVFERHGKFNLKNFNLIIRDIFGLTRFIIKSNFNNIIFVYPYFLKSENIPFFLDKGGEEVIQSIVKVNSTDFFENRKYYPGDDTRRINWKIFAHSGELHIREVEKIPPKIGQISILFTPNSINFYEYEYITSLFLSTVYFLLKFNFQIKIFYPNNVNGILVDKTKENEFNNIINNSYDPINFNVNTRFKNIIIFSSFEEYSKLLKLNIIKKSFAVVTYYYELIEENQNILKFIYSTYNFDSLLKEIFYKLKKRKDEALIEKEVSGIKDLSVINKINLKLYRVDNAII